MAAHKVFRTSESLAPSAMISSARVSAARRLPFVAHDNRHRSADFLQAPLTYSLETKCPRHFPVASDFLMVSSQAKWRRLYAGVMECIAGFSCGIEARDAISRLDKRVQRRFDVIL